MVSGFFVFIRAFFNMEDWNMADESLGEAIDADQRQVTREIPRAKESKAQRAERLKRAKNPWDHLAELRAYARYGYKAFPDEWIGTYLRWWGVYPQGDG